ncbi:lasso peptide isopeptide bond-forming cyclase [Saccharopolyspora sp. 5N708]|uniref:lasso peptide isopeptide bond-forming cyclase n=1 Tax=Saccharopolyspora sp. 5N708 TaxID=3457424 RepID=UPI003FD4432C
MSAGFVVLPDTAEAQAALRKAPFQAPRVVQHFSGRPWLVGEWAPEECVLASTGPVRVVVIGVCPVTTARLRDLAARVRELSDVDVLARGLPGSFHLVAAVDDRIRVQGSASGLRQVFSARVDRVPVAGDRADVLAAMSDASVDEQVLAVRMACGPVPPPLGERSVWSTVSVLPADHHLIIEPAGTREVRSWWPPAPELPLAAGAAALREALDTALSGRHRGDGRLSADLSGGMDSTSLCFLAARDTPELLTLHWGEAESANDDAVFTSHAASRLPRAEHLTIAQGDLPTIFSDPAAPTGLAEPYLFSRTAARTRFTAHLLAAAGSRRHISGDGGDELFTNFPGYLHGLLRRRPLTAIRHVRGYRALKRWPLADTVAGMLRGDDMAAWWLDQADRLTEGSTSLRLPALDWGLQSLRAQDWVTPAASSAARAALREAAERAVPLAGDRGQHQAVLALRGSAPAYAQRARLFAESGVELDMPFFDDRVIEAALAVRPHERTTPWRYKPLLADAMRGIAPDRVLDRSTKGEFGEDVRVGLRRNLPAVLDVLADSALAARGLIDPDAVRAELLAPQADNTTIIALERLLGCETWLREATRPTPPRSTNAASAS